MRQIAKQALKLWESCLDELNQTKAFIDFRAESLGKELERQKQIPMPEKFPVNFDELLKLWIGGRNKDYRIKIYREYLKELIWRGHVSQIKYPNVGGQKYRQAVMTTELAEALAESASLDEIEEGMIDAKKRTIASDSLYRLEARNFLNWFAEYKAEIRQKRAMAGAEALKKKRNKNGAPKKN